MRCKSRTSPAALAALSIGLSLGSSTAVQSQEARPALDIPVVEVIRVDSPDAALAPAVPQVLAEKLAKKQAQKARGLERYDKPAEALDFDLRKRRPAGETTLPVERYIAALGHMQGMRRYSTALRRTLTAWEATEIDRALADGQAPLPALGTWQPLGPGNVGGRTRGLLVHPTTPSTMYAAGVAGGVWKTTNGGTSWTPLSDLIDNIAINALAMDPDDPNVLYAGTGEGFFNIDAVRGAGIFKTTNGGATWTALANTTTNSDFWFVNDIVVSPTSSSRIYAATWTGVWRSTNGGDTWSLRLSASDCTDLAVRTDMDPDVVFAACGNFDSDGVYRSTDGGQTFSAAPVLTAANLGRVSLAIAPSNQNVIYALGADMSDIGAHRLLQVYRSTTGGGTGSWSARVNTAVKLNRHLLSNTVFAHFSDCGFGIDQVFSQGWYDNVIAVDPLDSNRVWAGGIDLFRSDDGGANWGQASHWWADPAHPHLAHADQHAIVFHPGYNGTTNKQMFVGNDGGLFRTLDARAATAVGNTAPCDFNNGSVAWSSLNNGYAVTQFYHGVPYPDGTQYFGGTQDNGTVRGNNVGGPNGWAMIQGGDGGYVAVNPSNTNTLYAEFTGISIQKSTDGGVTFNPATTGINDPGGLFINPFTMDPNNPSILWTGGWYFWRTTNAAAGWTRGSDITPGGGSTSAIAIAKGNSNRALAAMSDGFILRSSAALSAGSTTAWPFTMPAAGYVSSLAFDPSNDMVAYATYSSFGVPHVWRSTDGGATWTRIDGTGGSGLPDIPAHSIVVDPSDPATLYVGTDLGVFVSRDRGANWFVEQTGFANVVTEALNVNTAGGVGNIYAFTHGRGAWKVTSGTATGGFAAPVITSPGAGSTIGVRGITFSWDALGGGVDLYDLLVTDLANGQVVFSGSLRGAASTAALVTLESGDYQFKVRGCAGTVSKATCGNFAVTTFTVDLLRPSAAPVISAPTQDQAFTSSTQTFGWSSVTGAPGGGTVRYEVLLEDVTGGTTELQIATNELSTIFSMHGSTEYKLRVRACQQGCGPYSNPRRFSVDLPNIPGAAPNITSAVVTGNELDLSWSAVPRADLYTVQVIQPTGGPGGGALTVGARQVSTLALNDLPLPAGAANVIVQGCNGDGCGPTSAPTPINVAGPNPATPNVAKPVAGTIAQGPVLNLSWNRIAGDNGSNTVYRLFVQDLSRQAPAVNVFTTQNFWSAFLKAEGGRYDAVVIAPGNVVGTASGFNVAGASATAPTMTRPAHQGQVAAGNIDLAWSEVPGATLYEYFVAVQGQPQATVRGVTQGLSVKVPLAAAGGNPTVYSAIARACPEGATCAPGSNAGWGPWSNEPGGPGVTNFTVTP